ncbi:hypothetical protein [Deinococcus maricopensis]|uniref:Heme exporter protein D n=1 Tax=Deinococcus maricopensis (strain DSM 21211 / LMG 22137 / NRRL B-23946 / LB-34) TaxID=709986 RepID=E8U6W4_DEIML|nr:hypothetical protein [Deinococcus maricopensis]ADV66803.1 hypothetical protein Deima_1151 [Deinococcus maricopensis DSM 21211]
MDKYSVYVLIVYAVTFIVLFGYLYFVWSRLWHERAQQPEDRA